MIHPGMFMSPAMTRALAADVRASPDLWRALDRLRAQTPVAWSPRPLEVVDGGLAVCAQDGQTAASAALVFTATGEEPYARVALSILEAWAATNKAWRGNDALSEASWSACTMVRAAELLKHAEAPAIRRLWAGIEGAVFAWLRAVVLPVLHSECDVHFARICAGMQIAILLEDRQEWSRCLGQYGPALAKAIAEGGRPGQEGAFLLGSAAQAAEMAWHQGVDLYDDRLAACVERQARFVMRGAGCGEPVWEIPLAHFAGRRGRRMPKTEECAARARPDKCTFMWGPNTLTHWRPSPWGAVGRPEALDEA